MKHCATCNNRIWFWNKYHRNYPAVEISNIKTTNLHFCCSQCVLKYINLSVERFENNKIAQETKEAHYKNNQKALRKQTRKIK